MVLKKSQYRIPHFPYVVFNIRRAKTLTCRGTLSKREGERKASNGTEARVLNERYIFLSDQEVATDVGEIHE